jgi:hypothetical protein
MSKSPQNRILKSKKGISGMIFLGGGLLSWNSCSAVSAGDMLFYDRSRERMLSNSVGECE